MIPEHLSWFCSIETLNGGHRGAQSPLPPETHTQTVLFPQAEQSVPGWAFLSAPALGTGPGLAVVAALNAFLSVGAEVGSREASRGRGGVHGREEEKGAE